MAENTGTLYIVPTPIGNLEDITLRALRILKEVDIICAEDTRHSRKLLTHFGISTRLISYYREKEREKAARFTELLIQGKNLAVISDAGTPAVSDPGAILVAAAHKKGLPVVALPGASAAITAFSASGITAPGFIFLGFPPAKSAQRKKLLREIHQQQFPVIFYESPRRIQGFIEDALEILGDRDAFWARELTKNYEELIPATLSRLQKKAQNGVKGELVVVICPGQQTKPDKKQLEKMLCWHRDNSDITVRDISRKLAKELKIPKSEIYQLALTLWAEK